VQGAKSLVTTELVATTALSLIVALGSMVVREPIPARCPITIWSTDRGECGTVVIVMKGPRCNLAGEIDILTNTDPHRHLEAHMPIIYPSPMPMFAPTIHLGRRCDLHAEGFRPRYPVTAMFLTVLDGYLTVQKRCPGLGAPRGLGQMVVDMSALSRLPVAQA
jgi:hypothetical protein